MDDKIRKLEKKADETKDANDIASYWLSCLRSNIIPKPATEFKYGLQDNLDSTIVVAVWTLYPNDYDNKIASSVSPPRILAPEKGNVDNLYNYYELLVPAGLPPNRRKFVEQKGDITELPQMFRRLLEIHERLAGARPWRE